MGESLLVKRRVDLRVQMIRHETLIVQAGFPLATVHFLAHAGDDAPSPRDAILGEVRLCGTISHEIVEHILSALCVERTNRSDEIRGNVRRPVVDGRSGMQQGGEGCDVGDFAV